jgi:hypothetical protein
LAEQIAGQAKKKGLAHYLHKQWVATSTGAELHKADVARQKKLPVKPKRY